MTLFASYEEARVAVEQAALDELAARDRALLEDLLRPLRRRLRGGEGG